MHPPTPPFSAADKQALRKSLLARRRSLTPEALERASRHVRDRLADLPAWRNAGEVLLYKDFAGEIATGPLLDELWRRGARVLIPRCRPGETGLLDLANPLGPQDLTPGAYGILEPNPETCPAVTDFSPDLALIPAVAFDRTGARLGFGQGYYDRLLAGPGFSRTLLAGLAHAFQVVDRLPSDPWDKPVQVIVTDEETLWP
ncbi:5-formyltetrahydrofolate cyclo-ligase [Fundidesulfovibrio butyratiphilus]